MYCEQCGQLISDDSSFCFRCGHAVASSQPDSAYMTFVCPNCGKEFEPENVFCDFCGFKLVAKVRPGSNKVF